MVKITHTAICCRFPDPAIHPGPLTTCPLCMPTVTTSGGAQDGALSPNDGPGGAFTPPTQDPGPSFYLTFGVQYEKEPHPNGLWIHPDGWVTICAPSYQVARSVVLGLFQDRWDGLYVDYQFDRHRHLYPKGELLRIVVPAGQLEEEDHRD